MSYKSFYVSFTLKVDEQGNILSLVEEEHPREVAESIANAIHDIDDVKVEKIKVKERW
jgi:hypothetical protein|tara:strand:+ start:850 stop:1023 length:174 start_codon:yes stop_codon:yes gene_type:complete